MAAVSTMLARLRGVGERYWPVLRRFRQIGQRAGQMRVIRIEMAI